MLRAPITRDGVQNAVAEFDALGRAAFLERYGFSPARDYFLVHEGRQYDSKAVVAVAYKWASSGEGRALTAKELSGGKDHAAKLLRSLGFTVMGADRNADWTWDEHVLALDLYMTNPTSPSGKGSPEVAELSRLLNQLGAQSGVAMSDKFRNANGVYMKMMNFRRFDPMFQAQGKVGLGRGSKGEQGVWDFYKDDLVALRAAAAAIKEAIGRGAAQPDGLIPGNKTSIIVMRQSIQRTTRYANGQIVERTAKNKELRMNPEELEQHLANLLDRQGNRCAVTGIPFHFHGPYADRHLLPSPDRIDSDGHYEQGNLQIVCQFVNFWKSSMADVEFRRLLQLVQDYG